ncbi:DUF1642 domain-containing protein [Streptococcus intermedius]|uniref:DUF1642 domain-containing protein n=1 Tax=Streptococcus intermedius TaxID=1338 RepID=UPI0012390139|nr:DUF1642 domain-containing protein [Streptococcus intermedius]
MTEFKVGDEVWVKGVINQIDKGNAWDLYISTRENGVWIDSCLGECIPRNDTDEKPRYLRNVLARLRELPEHDRKVWMDEIMHEFANDYGSVKHTLGYEQGKLDGAVEAEKSNKVVIPRFVAEYIEECKKQRRSLKDSMDKRSAPFKVSIWLMRLGEYYNYKNQELFARAWLDGYDVEREKRYRIKMKNEKYNHTVVIGDYTRKELEDAGFGWVFDCEDVEVQEVE